MYGRPRSPSALPTRDAPDRGFRNWHSSSYRESRRVFVRFSEIQTKSEFAGFRRKFATFRRLRRGALYPAELRVHPGFSGVKSISRFRDFRLFQFQADGLRAEGRSRRAPGDTTLGTARNSVLNMLLVGKRLWCTVSNQKRQVRSALQSDRRPYDGTVHAGGKVVAKGCSVSVGAELPR
jgi:hypothetical protein